MVAPEDIVWGLGFEEGDIGISPRLNWRRKPLLSRTKGAATHPDLLGKEEEEAEDQEKESSQAQRMRDY
jgi:hypothetical protein